MIGLEGIIAIIGLSFQVIAAIDKAVEIFDRIENAPHELQQFRKSVKKLHANFNLLKAELEINNQEIPYQRDLEDVRDTLTLCESALVKYHKTYKGSTFGALRATWSPRERKQLERYQKQIEDHYTEILYPIWFALLAARCRPSPASQVHESSSSISDNWPSPTIVDQEYIDLSQRLEDLKSSNEEAHAKQIRQDIDATLGECLKRRGLPREDIDDFTGLPVARDRRGSLDKFENAPTTLILETAPKNHRKLELHGVNIMTKDSKSRILRYQNQETQTQVTQIIPIGCIPWTPDKHSLRVSFLGNHHLTVIERRTEDEEHHIYNIDPKYQFKKFDHCKKFQETLRDRKYIGAHDAVKVKMGKELLALRQVITFWARQDATKGRIVTLTFLASSLRPHRHEELKLGDFRQHPDIVQPKLWRKGEKHKIELEAVSSSRKLRVKFESNADALAFRTMFVKEHPANELTPLPPLELSNSSMSSSTPVPTPSDTISIRAAPPRMNSLDLEDGVPPKKDLG